MIQSLNMSNDKLLQKRTLYHSDRVADLLIEKLNLSPLTFGLLSIAIATALFLVTAWVSNTLWFPPGHQPPGLLQHGFPWVWVLFINPIVLGYYLWSFEAINDVVQHLEKSHVVKTDKPNQLSDEIIQKPEASDLIETKEKELRAFYTLTDEFPVWPFDVQTFRRFLLTVPAPFLPLIPKLIEALLKKWGVPLG
jgi:hypothetical protein